MSERRTLTIGVAINVGNYESLRLEVSDCVQTEEEAAELAAYLNRVLDGYAQNDATTRASIDKYRTRVLEKHVPETPASPSPDPLDELFGPVPDTDGVVKREEQKTPVPVTVAETLKVPEPVIVQPEPVKPEETPKVPEPVSAEPEPVIAEETPKVSEPVSAEPEPVKPEETPKVPEPVIVQPEPVKAEETPKVPEPVIVQPEPVNTEEKPAPAAAAEPVTYTCEKCGAVVSKVQRDVSNLFMGKTLCKTCMK